MADTAAAGSPTEVVDLTTAMEEEATTVAANVTPDRRPAKRVRASRRLEALREREEEEEERKKSGRSEEEGAADGTPHYEGEDPRDGNHTNGYFEVDEILDRRTRKYGSESAGLRQVVEYLVSWKKPPNYAGDEAYYEPSWLIAENLDQNSLADAFRKFPMDADPDRSSLETMRQAEEDRAGDFDLEAEFSDDEEEESDDEEEDMMDNSSDDMQDYDEEDGSKSANVIKDREVSHLGDSDYDSPGTVELVINRKTYRVGQSFFSSNEKFVYSISMIHPIPRNAKCHEYMRMEKSFVCPKGRENSYVLLSEDVTLDLTYLKLPCRVAFEKYPIKYKQENENQRSFSYYNETGKILHHPAGRPAVLELFAGAGGMSLGLGKYFDVKWVVDNDPLACATFSANKTKMTQVYAEDVKTFLRKSVQGNSCYPGVGQVDHIHASPPCKGFSRANRNGGKDDLQNNKQTLLFIKAIHHFRPKTATFENVPGLILDDNKGYLQSIVSSLLQMGYQVRCSVLTSSAYGDPQKRRRLILVAARNDCMLPVMPPPTHGPGLLPIKTCKDALEILEKHDPSSSRSSGTVLIDNTLVFNHIIPGHKHEKDADFELIEDEPSRTILAKARPHLHYGGHRFISVREAACLQSFPLSYQFFGSLSNQFSQVGNAVPVKLATAIARSVAVVHGCAV